MKNIPLGSDFQGITFASRFFIFAAIFAFIGGWVYIASTNNRVSNTLLVLGETDTPCTLSGNVTITGNTQFGQVLSVNTSGLVYTPSTDSNIPTYQWKRDNTVIDGVTGSTYTISETDIGKEISVIVSGDGIHAVGSVTSQKTSAITKASGLVISGVSMNDRTNTMDGLTEAMEFSTNGVSWTQFNSVFMRLPNLEGSISLQVRMKESSVREAGPITTFEFTIPTLSSISVTTQPEKMAYKVGDSLNIDGLIVTGTYSDGSKKIENISINDISGFSSANPAVERVLTITFAGKTTTFGVTIVSANQTIPGSSGEVLLNDSTSQVVVGTSQIPLIVNVETGTTHPTVNYGQLISNGSGDIPQTTINSPIAIIQIPKGIISSTDPGWNGVFEAPTLTSATLSDLPTESSAVTQAIEMGSPSLRLVFNKGVRIFIPKAAGKRVGTMRTGESFSEITAYCAEDSQNWADNNLATGGDCKANVDADLVVWTKHFTKFITYTVKTITVGDSNKDGKVDKYDFALMMANWGRVGTNSADLNNDKKVDKYDFSLLMANWNAL